MPLYGYHMHRTVHTTVRVHLRVSILFSDLRLLGNFNLDSTACRIADAEGIVDENEEEDAQNGLLVVSEESLLDIPDVGEAYQPLLQFASAAKGLRIFRYTVVTRNTFSFIKNCLVYVTQTHQFIDLNKTFKKDMKTKKGLPSL